MTQGLRDDDEVGRLGAEDDAAAPVSPLDPAWSEQMGAFLEDCTYRRWDGHLTARAAYDAYVGWTDDGAPLTPQEFAVVLQDQGLDPATLDGQAGWCGAALLRRADSA